MPNMATAILFISRIIELSLLAGFSVPVFSQAPAIDPLPDTPHRLDLAEEKRRLRWESVGGGAVRAEYKTTADAAALANAEPVFAPRPEPSGAISAQRLRHHPPKAARKTFARGVTAQREGRRGEAIEQFNEAVSLDPLYVEARAELGVLYVRTGEISKALQQFELASELEPNSSMLHFNRAWALLVLGRAVEAEREARRVLALKPEEADAHRLIGLALAAQAAGQ